jgi:glycosyltransferase involved in cell wall biosynthesis
MPQLETKRLEKLRLLQIYNQYRSLFNGEETVVFRTAQLIERHGGQARLWMRSSRDMKPGLTGKVKAFISGIYNSQTAREATQLIKEYQPEVVHVHNLYPLFSPSVLLACRRANVPVVMTLHNQQLTCPRADHLRRGQICDRCLDGSVLNCVLRNCRENLAESIGYAARSAVARHWRLFRDNVTVFIALTDFARQRLVRAGFDAERIVVLPNMAPAIHEPIVPSTGTYVAFAGRLSAEKGLSVLIAAAERAEHMPVKIAGGGPLFSELCQHKPSNAELLGQLSQQDLPAFYRGARFLVLPSVNYEMCPLVISEAMSHGLPVVASRIGGIPELVDHGRTGLLFQPGDVDDLQAQMQRLWHDARLCRDLGRAAWEKATTEFSEDTYYARLMNVYRCAMELTGTTPRFSSEPKDTELAELIAP